MRSIHEATTYRINPLSNNLIIICASQIGVDGKSFLLLSNIDSLGRVSIDEKILLNKLLEEAHAEVHLQPLIFMFIVSMYAVQRLYDCTCLYRSRLLTPDTAGPLHVCNKPPAFTQGL